MIALKDRLERWGDLVAVTVGDDSCSGSVTLGVQRA